MTQKKQIYKCRVCGNIVEVLHEGEGELVCCGEPMGLHEEKTQDEGLEKHVPVIERTSEGFLVKVGSVPHPMEKEHYIEWVELIMGDRSFRKFLKPGDGPEFEFKVNADSGNVSAREYCNIHGLWKSNG